MANNSFAERLTQLRNEKGLKREDVAKVLGCSVSAVGNYENGNRTPDFDSLIKLVDYFNTTIDYLLGKTDIQTDDRDLQFVCQYTGLSSDAVEKLREEGKNAQLPYNELISEFITKVDLQELSKHVFNYLCRKKEWDSLQEKYVELTKERNALTYTIDSYRKQGTGNVSDIKNELLTVSQQLHILGVGLKQAKDSSSLELFRIQQIINEFVNKLVMNRTELIAKEIVKNFMNSGGDDNGNN